MSRSSVREGTILYKPPSRRRLRALTEGVQPIEFAEILAQAGDVTRALDWLERACAEQDFMMTYVRVLPTLRPLHAEPRFLNIVRRGCAVSK